MPRKGQTQSAMELAGGVVDPRKLLYLATIMEQGSLAKAAKLLGLSQPALSKSMDRLENELGMKLLERGPKGIAPTESGEFIYSHARLIKEEMDLAEARIQGHKSHARVLTLGTLPSLASSVIPLAISRWRERHPNTLLRVIEKVQVELILGLLRCEFDFVVGQTEYYDFFLDGLKQRVLFRDRLCVFARPGHDLFRMRNLSWANLVQYPWVCPMVGWPQRTVLEKLVEAQGVAPPRQLVECGSISFTKSLVAASDHLAILPAHSVASEVSDDAIKALAINVSALKRDIAVIFRQRSPLDSLSQDLIAHIEAMGKELSGASLRASPDGPEAE